MKGDVALFTTHVQTCSQPDLLQDRFDVGGKTRNIAIQLVLQQCCKTSCTFLLPVSRYLPESGKFLLVESGIRNPEKN